jgi:DNA-binding NtrC family response regulator
VRLRGAHPHGRRRRRRKHGGGIKLNAWIHSLESGYDRLVEEVHKIRSSDVTVLVTGESGTGKELVARCDSCACQRVATKIFVPSIAPQFRRNFPKVTCSGIGGALSPGRLKTRAV